MAEARPSTVKLWDKTNGDKQEIVSLSERYQTILRNNLSDLTKNVQFSPLVPYLLQLDVIDRETRDTIQLNAIEATQTLRLVEHIQRGPCWRLHGFLHALVQTQQSHIVTLLGLKPEDYGDIASPATSTPMKHHFYRRVESEQKLQISNDLLPGLLQHCGSYTQTLMKGSTFGHRDGHPIDLTDVWECPEAECRQNQSTYKSISRIDMFMRLFQRHPPNSVSLEGPAGAGKSTFMEDYALDWSRDVTSCEANGLDVPCEGHLWKLVLYIPLGGIRGNFTDVIQNNLKCQPELQQKMMAEINRDGEGVLVIGDGIDELRDEKSKQSLLEYTRSCQEMVTKPKVLITARDGLLTIPRRCFDRELYIKGFSPEQGVAYMAKYFKAMYQITEHPVLDYSSTHIEELRWVLINPLQVHILSELTASGFLTLGDLKTLTTIKLFRSLDHLMMRRDEDRGLAEVYSSTFYRACLRCLLNNERQITEDEVGRGSPYLSLLTKGINDRDQDLRERQWYDFTQEMVLEFFAMRGIIDYIKSTPTNKKALLLYFSSNLNMQNVLLLTYGFISQFEREMFSDIVVATIRCWLLVQTDMTPCVKNELTNELSTLSDQIQQNFPKDILSSGLTTEQRAKMDRMFDMIQDMFNERSNCLKKYGWAPTKAKHSFWSGISPKHKFILSSLDQCTPEDRAEVLSKTTQCLLPCATHDCQAEYVVHHVGEEIFNHIIPVNGKFAVVQSRNTYPGDSSRLFINIWCLQDLIPIIDSHKQLSQLRQTDDRYKELRTTLKLAHQFRGIHLYVNSTVKELWGSLPDSAWSEAEWTLALKHLLRHYETSSLRLYINHQVGWIQLLSACRKVISCGHKLTEGLGIFHGKTSVEDLLQFSDWAREVGLAVYVTFLTVVMGAGCDPEQWQNLDSEIRQRMGVLRGEWSGKPRYITYISSTGEVLCERYNV